MSGNQLNAQGADEPVDDAEAYAIQLDTEDEPQALPRHFPNNPEEEFAAAARDALYAMRDAIRDMKVAAAYTENSQVADRLRRDGTDPELVRRLLSEIQNIIARTGSAYSKHMFGVDVDLK